ncbi:MAG: ABC transporter permease [Verrucomicrobiota bacterium]
MIFLPIVERELRVAARGRAAYWTRFAAGLGAIGFTIMILVSMTYASPSAVGQSLFTGLASVVFFVCLFSGPTLTADTLSSEKREGTLGLLFLTDLKGYDIVMGKLAATSLTTIYSALAVVPVLSFPLLMGGVGLAELGRVVLAFGNALFFSLSCGLFASAVCVHARKAAGLAFLLVGGFTVLAPMFGVILLEQSGHKNFVPMVLMFSPGCAFITAFAPVYKQNFAGNNVWLHWASQGITHALAWLLLLAACWITPRTWRDKGMIVEGRSWRARWHQFWMGSRAWRNQFRPPMLTRNPFLWLVSRERWKVELVWFWLGASGVLWLYGWWNTGRYWLEPENYIFTAIVLQLVLKLWVTGEACRQFGPDRRSSAMELLLVTPLTEREIIQGQVQALFRQFLFPALLVLGLHAGFLAWNWHDPEWHSLWLAGMIWLCGDLPALAWTGMWLSLRTASAERGMTIALLLVMVVPWLVYAATLLAVGVATDVLHWIKPVTPTDLALTIYWIVLSLLNNLILYAWARRRLHTNFRTMAARPVGATPK